MCLDFIYTKVFPFYYGFLIITTMVVVAKSQYQSPCPRTFQYERDTNGDIYGAIGVYSFQEDVVDLTVELSMGNPLQGFSGKIELVIPRNQVVDTIRKNRPLKYKIYFPRWTNEPPKLTKIIVNGRTVCTGPPAQFNEYTQIVSTVTLGHQFINSSPLSFRPPDDNSDNINHINPKNPFIPRREPNGNKGNNGNRNPFLPNINRPQDQNVFIIKDEDNIDVRNQYGDDFLNVYFTTTTTSTTTPRPRRPVTVRSQSTGANDLLFSENPFLNGRASPVPSSPPPRRTPRPRVQPKPKLSSQSTSGVCGVAVATNPLIVNGKSVPPGAFPWLTAMFASTGLGVEYRCCGSLVSHKHVITAAHCVGKSRKSTTPISPNKLHFVLGKHNIENLIPGKGEKIVGAEDVKIHPEYTPDTSDADLAVVTLSQEIDFTNYIRPICIWNEFEDIDAIVKQKGTVVGWGRDENNMMSPEPKQVSMSVVSQEECLRSADIFKYITSNRSFCAGNRDNTGPCNGDSGSGFIMKRNNRWTLRGIVSISTYDSDKQLCDLSNYVAFTDVSKFRSWLLSIIVI